MGVLPARGNGFTARGPFLGAPMTVEQFADWLAHVGAAEFGKLSISRPDAPVTRATSAEQSGVRIVVTVAHIEREPYREMRSDLPPVETPVPKLTPALRQILSVMNDKPAKAETLAARLKFKKCHGSFRERCAKLCKMKLAKHVDGGYVLARPEGGQGQEQGGQGHSACD